MTTDSFQDNLMGYDEFEDHSSYKPYRDRGTVGDVLRHKRQRRQKRQKDNDIKKPLFKLGKIVATPPALDLLDKYNVLSATMIKRHVFGDWEEMNPHDRKANHDALKYNDRVFSSYDISPDKSGAKIWVITEHDRSVTTILLPSCY